MRLLLVRSTLAAGMAAGLLLSPRLWLTDRHFPTVPVWDGLPAAPPAAGYLVLGCLLALLALVVMLPLARWPVLAVVTLAGGWALWDQTRWQPWVYQYLAMLAAVGVARTADGGLNACRFVLAATYFWSGLQKVNVGFATDLYPWMMGPLIRLLPDAAAAWAEGQGWTVAVVECGLGLALLVRPLRVLAVPLVVLMHAAVLYCLGPTGHGWNSVVWPWNAALMALVVTLFAGTRGVPTRQLVWPGSWPGRVALVLFGVMPGLSFVGCWDPYLSAALYSGNVPRPRVVLSGAAADALPPHVRETYFDGDELDLSGWAMDELNVPVYPARRVFRKIARRLGGPPDVRLITRDRPHWRTGDRSEIEEHLADG